jgi:hypothetical protein
VLYVAGQDALFHPENALFHPEIKTRDKNGNLFLRLLIAHRKKFTMLTEAKKETTDQDDITTMATKPTKRKIDNEADNTKPPAVLRTNASFTSLPMQLQIEIMSYADVRHSDRCGAARNNLDL